MCAVCGHRRHFKIAISRVLPPFLRQRSVEPDSTGCVKVKFGTLPRGGSLQSGGRAGSVEREPCAECHAANPRGIRERRSTYNSISSAAGGSVTTGAAVSDLGCKRASKRRE